MSKNKKIGEKGESIALEFLTNKGYQLIHKNYRFSRFEIDLIMKVNDTLVFVEVKTRSDTKFGYPEDWVDNTKVSNILEASDHFIHQVNWDKSIRYDVIAILVGPKIEIRHFEDAFY